MMRLSIAVMLSALACATTRTDQHVAERQRLEASVAALGVQMAQLQRELDSLVAQNDSLRRSASRLEEDLADREEQIRAIRLELQRLKEIDLKPRRPY